MFMPRSWSSLPTQVPFPGVRARDAVGPRPVVDARVDPLTGNSEERTPWKIPGLLAVAQFMVILDIRVVNVALPSIGRELGFAAEDLRGS
jgi:hypothetical protein